MNKLLAGFLIIGLLCVSATAWTTMQAATSKSHPVNTGLVQSYNPLQLSYVARGPECPTKSGEYCSDEYKYCCLINSEWTCVAELKDCKDD